MKHILDRYPDRFGWRGWLIAPQEMGLGGRLIAPFTGTVLNGQAMEMHCPHGNTGPTPRCSCGAHYSLYPGQMFEMAKYFPCPAVTFGVGLGDAIPDFDSRRPWFRRAWRYHVLGIFIPRLRRQG